MRVTVKREIFTTRSTIGSFKLGPMTFYTLEPAKNPADRPNSLLIPPGLYKAVIYVSPKFTEQRGYPFRVPLLQDVPGRTEIEWHIGNLPSDTEGCTLIGLSRSPDALGYSTDAFFQCFHRLIEPLEIEYVNPPGIQ